MSVSTDMLLLLILSLGSHEKAEMWYLMKNIMVWCRILFKSSMVPLTFHMLPHMHLHNNIYINLYHPHEELWHLHQLGVLLSHSYSLLDFSIKIVGGDLWLKTILCLSLSIFTIDWSQPITIQEASLIIFIPRLEQSLYER